VRYRQLGTHGPVVSELGFGASPLGGIYGGFAEKAGIEAVHAALDAGITFFDVAPYYGLAAAETVLGKALRGIDRDLYVLATKVGRYGGQVFDFSAGAVTHSLRGSLARNAAILDPVPAGCWADPEDFAGAAVFLASRASDYVHGAIVTVAGGWFGR
jgi:aryl-alcohol dehydrogenase-like predicted oxidoreductase